ncbi:hypothetical protein [Termitidicoccus mucosus]|uniref:hypothetical protein n=1 Tax=Termitidicoccus mucosus TaxID=1184151 RepID=UPI003CCB7C9F
MLRRWGAAIPRSTLCEWIHIGANWLEPIYKAMLRGLLEGDYILGGRDAGQVPGPRSDEGGHLPGLPLDREPARPTCALTGARAAGTASCHVGRGFCQRASVRRLRSGAAYAAHQREHPKVT